MQTKNTYLIPVPLETVTLTVRDNPSHQGAYKGSIDFAVPINTRVFAGADGIVTRVRDDSDKYGANSKYGQAVNYITINHDNDEISEYLHLAKASSQVKVGDKVKAGQKIAKTGLSGWLTDPHLHFMVYKRTSSKQDFHCLEVRLKH